MQNYLAAVTPYLTKDNLIRIGLIGVGIMLLAIAGSKLVPNHSVRSLFRSAPAIERPAVKVEKPATKSKLTPKKRVQSKKVAPKKVTPQAPVEQPQGWTRVCGNDNWCNWVYYP